MTTLTRPAINLDMVAKTLYDVLIGCLGGSPNWRWEQDKQPWLDLAEFGRDIVIENLEKSRRNPNAVFMTWENLAKVLYESKYGSGFDEIPLTQKVAWEMVGRAITSIIVDQEKIGPTTSIENFLLNIEVAAFNNAQDRLEGMSGMNGKHAHEEEVQPGPEKQSEAAPIAKDSVRDQLERKAQEYEARAARLRQLVNVVTEEDLEILRVIFNKENVNG